MKNNKRFFVCVSGLTALAVLLRVIDPKIAALVYNGGNYFGGFCEIAGAAIPFLLCAFCFATMMFCRHTKTTLKNNRILTVIYGIASLISTLAAFFMATYKSSNKNYYLLAGFSAVLTAIFVYLAATLFKNNYQKSLMTKYAKIGIISSLASVTLFFIAKLIPQRPSYEALRVSMEKFGNYDSPEEFVPFLALSGIGAAMIMWITCLPDIFPKLRFSGKFFFAISVVWAAAMLIGTVSSGHTYASEFICGLAAAYTIQFATKKIFEKKFDSQ